MTSIPKPQANSGEYAPYAQDYIDAVPGTELELEQLTANLQSMKDLVSHLSDEALSTPHEAGEWTIKEILVHVIDSERVFAYRALRLARGDTTPLAGFEQNDYVPMSGANQRRIEDIFAEYSAVRQASITLFASFDDEAMLRKGTASGFPVTVRGLLFQVAGHELHHLNSIRENYLS